MFALFSFFWRDVNLVIDVVPCNSRQANHNYAGKKMRCSLLYYHMSLGKLINKASNRGVSGVHAYDIKNKTLRTTLFR